MAEALRVDHRGLLYKNSRFVAVELDRRSERGRPGTDRGWRNEGRAQRHELVRLDDDRVAGAPLLTSACASRRRQAEDLATNHVSRAIPVRGQTSARGWLASQRDLPRLPRVPRPPRQWMSAPGALPQPLGERCEPPRSRSSRFPAQFSELRLNCHPSERGGIGSPHECSTIRATNIGAPGFEPGTSPTRTVRATRLRHAPSEAIIPEGREDACRGRRSALP
jgi:hypothetical protein